MMVGFIVLYFFQNEDAVKEISNRILRKRERTTLTVYCVIKQCMLYSVHVTYLKTGTYTLIQ